MGWLAEHLPMRSEALAREERADAGWTTTGRPTARWFSVACDVYVRNGRRRL